MQLAAKPLSVLNNVQFHLTFSSSGVEILVNGKVGASDYERIILTRLAEAINPQSIALAVVKWR